MENDFVSSILGLLFWSPTLSTNLRASMPALVILQPLETPQEFFWPVSMHRFSLKSENGILPLIVLHVYRLLPRREMIPAQAI